MTVMLATSVANGWEWLSPVMDSTTLERSSNKIHPWNSLSQSHPQTLNHCLAHTEQAKLVHVSMSAGIQQKSTKSNEMTQSKRAHQKFKKRLQQQFGKVKKLVKLDKKSKSHAKCFETQFHDATPFLLTQCMGAKAKLFDNQRQPHWCGQTIWHPKLHPVCQIHNDKTSQIWPTTFCQLWQRNLWCLWTQAQFSQQCKTHDPPHWWVNELKISQPNAQSCHRFHQVQHLPGWSCMTGGTAKKKK